MAEFEDLKPGETQLIGAWVNVDGRVDGDQPCQRVQFLVSERLDQIGYSKESGAWETLFRDPNDGRFWGQAYPHSDWHGGGPPALINLSETAARSKYPPLFKD